MLGLSAGQQVFGLAAATTSGASPISIAVEVLIVLAVGGAWLRQWPVNGLAGATSPVHR